MSIFDKMAGIKKEKNVMHDIAKERLLKNGFKTAQGIYAGVLKAYKKDLEKMLLTPKMRRQMDRFSNLREDSGDEKIDGKRQNNNDYFLDQLFTFLEYALRKGVIK